MLICLDKSSRVISHPVIKWILVQNDLKLLKVNWDGVLAYYDSRVVFHVFYLFKPRMSTDIWRSESLGWICVENLLNEVATIITDKLRNRVISVQDLFVKNIGLWVLKRQVPAYHGIQNDTTRPNICCQTMVLLASNHFWSCVARTATSSFQSLARSISIWKTKIDNLNVVIVVHQ